MSPATGRFRRDTNLFNTFLRLRMRKSIPVPMVGALILIMIGCLSSMSGCVRRTVYPVLPVPFDQNELVDTWIGFNDDDATCYTLILQRTGDGVLYSHFEGGTVATNLIAHWGIQGSVLCCEFQQKDTPTRAALLESNVNKGLLVATLTGVGGWKEKVQFRRTEFLEQSVVKAKMFEETPPAAPHKP